MAKAIMPFQARVIGLCDGKMDFPHPQKSWVEKYDHGN